MARDKGKGSGKDDAAARKQAAEAWDKKQAEIKKHEAEVDEAGTHDDTYDKDKQCGKS